MRGDQFCIVGEKKSSLTLSLGHGDNVTIIEMFGRAFDHNRNTSRIFIIELKIKLSKFENWTTKFMGRPI